MSERTQVWSSGGGTQSAAIAALIVQGALPKPDYAVIVDTGRERASTWEYHDAVIVPALAAVGVELVRVAKEEFATVDLWSSEGSLLLPVFTDQAGKVGKLPTYCSNEWKQRVVHRWLRKQGVKECEQWIGISVDEMRRMRFSGLNWIKNRYVLVELRMRREDCVSTVQKMGWPEPPRSSCWMCPNLGDREWREMKEQRPAEFQAAVDFDHEIRATDPNAFLHGSGKPLGEVNLDPSQGGLFDDRACASGMCWV